MEAICSSKTSVDFQQTTWRYIPEDSTLQELIWLVVNQFTHYAQLYLIILQFFSDQSGQFW
jgi:hypothetical protein